MNRTFLIGNLGKDPEVRTTKSGYPVANLSVATTEYGKDEAGNRTSQTEWHSVVLFGNSAENAGKFLSKGSKVAVEGALRYRSYEKEDGSKRYVTEIAADRIEFLDPRSAD